MKLRPDKPHVQTYPINICRWIQLACVKAGFLERHSVQSYNACDQKNLAFSLMFCYHILKFLIILFLILCFVSEAWQRSTHMGRRDTWNRHIPRGHICIWQTCCPVSTELQWTHYVWQFSKTEKYKLNVATSSLSKWRC